MKRKLIRQGLGGYTIYLPKKWIEENNLKKGEELEVDISGKELIISSNFSPKKLETDIKLINSLESSIRTLINNAYSTGSDIIKINFQNEGQFRILDKMIKNTIIGFELTRKEKNYCIAEDIAELASDKFETILRKFFLEIDELFNITKKRIIENSKEEFGDIDELENRIFKYLNFCKRMICKQKLINKKSEFYWEFLVMIMHAQRALYHLNKDLKKKIKVSKEIEDIFDETYILFKLIEEAFFKKNVDILASVHEKNKNIIYDKFYPLIKKNKINGDEIIILDNLISCEKRIYLSNDPLSGIII